MRRVLAVLGPSGCGKTETRMRLLGRDSRFRIIPAFTTRSLREDETDRVKITAQEFNTLLSGGDLIAVRELYGAHYGTSLNLVRKAIADGNLPLLDWPIASFEELIQHFADDLFTLYLRPPSISELAERLSRDGRDPTGARLEAAIHEAEYVEASGLLGRMDQVLLSLENEQDAIAEAVYRHFASL